MPVYPKKYDVIVVGGGHAGVEASLSAARLGCSTLLLTMNLDAIAQMSCNPAIGGTAKGHLVREIDALGGEMGKAADLAGLQFKMLNLSKGPSVWSPRSQCDKKFYQHHLKWVCERQVNLDCKQAVTCQLIIDGDQVCGVESTVGVRFLSETVILTTGTFLQGVTHIGNKNEPGGRSAEPSALNFSDSLRKSGLNLGRLKTGTPPRIVKKSIDFTKTEPQFGDEPICYFSHWNSDLFHVEHGDPRNVVANMAEQYLQGSILSQLGNQMNCYLTRTTELTSKIIHKNLHESAMYSGAINGIGPRYCPAIEDKYIRFPNKPYHQIFLEPEGAFTDEIYVNGLSTSFPYDVQIQLLRSVVGCSNAEISRPAYAVEYDYSNPKQLFSSLETKVCRNLYLAGQINGTSGYEEAAAQGLIAGINAARRSQNLPPIVLGREQSYIGVMIDDLTSKGTEEPYRLFTSRAEFRLLLRQDNADQRLSELGFEIGLLSTTQITQVRTKLAKIHFELDRLERTYHGNEPLIKILRRPGVSYRDIVSNYSHLDLDPAAINQVEIIAKYAGYINRQASDVEKMKRLESKQIPECIDYFKVPSLKIEARQRLSSVRPITIGQASRLEGVSPADVQVLILHLQHASIRLATPPSVEAEDNLATEKF